ncbi:glycosyl hydrolase [Trichodelitschia bisporula]|uniref:Glycosyl hydrolase n=1 Tax=Trichodelitschia bisporula TaxID=703511 RepID=A0A6G1I498_9PEZI|nr:glycosyl hydrolase [Trichodelitschia bisporula]
MRRLFFGSFLLLASLVLADDDRTKYVNVFAGTQNGGNMFPGAVAGPFAMVKLGPDMAIGKAEAYVGFLPDNESVITGFSMMHESGIGGSAKYGVVSQLPVAGNVDNPLAVTFEKRAVPDQGAVGYYKSVLASGITVELAATEHVGLFQYTFPPNAKANVVVDVSHFLPSFRNAGWAQKYSGGALSISPDGHYEGSGTYSGGWNLAPDWTIYFCGRFDQSVTSARTFVGKDNVLSEIGKKPSVASKDRLGAVFSFASQKPVTSRVGISFISSAQACQNLDREIPAGTALDSVVNAAKRRWNSDVFAKISTTDTNPDAVALLYTSLYGMHLLPSNRTGENPLWQSSEPYYDDIFTFWDLFRCTTPLMHIIQPTAYSELLRSIVDVWRHEGFLPDARSSNFNGRTQGGSSADNILADAYVKGVKGGINWADAYQAMVTDAEKVPPPNFDKSAPDSSTQQGRGALPDWLQLGYITPRFTRAVTRAVEYSANDFGLYQVALGQGRDGDALRYLRRSRNWRNHWDANLTSLGTRGFLVPRMANGSLDEIDPLDCKGCYWHEAYYEGKPWEYTVNAHHDMAELVRLGGGNAAFEQRLDTLMDPSKRIFNPGNEPSFTTPYLYNYIGKQAKSVEQSRRVARGGYNAGNTGLPGASDAGAMQSWILWNMIGLYPVTGQTTFLIGSPWFRNLSIALEGGHTLTITSTAPDNSTGDPIYVQSLTLNGRPWTQNWATYTDLFTTSNTLSFVLGSNPVDWDTGPVPPSPASKGFFAKGKEVVSVGSDVEKGTRPRVATVEDADDDEEVVRVEGVEGPEGGDPEKGEIIRIEVAPVDEEKVVKGVEEGKADGAKAEPPKL